MLHGNSKLSAALSSFSLVFLLSACGSGSPEKTHQRVDVSRIAANSALSPTEKSEELAQAAERLATVQAFMYADAVAKSALVLDPKNLRARIWRAALGPLMEMRGVLTRIEPFVKTEPSQYAGYIEFITRFKTKNPERAMTDFLLDGPADIHNEREVQNMLDQVTMKYDELRRLMNEIKSQEISIYINDDAFKRASLGKAMDHCIVRQSQNGVYDLEDCDLSKAYEHRLNTADFEAIQQVAAGVQTYLSVLNAWDLTGVYSKSKRWKFRTVAENLKMVLKNPQFGILRNQNSLGQIPTLLKDAVIGARYALSMQETICPTGNPWSYENRPGYLFEKGFCANSTDRVSRTLIAVETMLAGQPAAIFTGDQTIIVDGLKFFAKPIQDLHSVAPVETNQCGEITGLADGTLGGVFPGDGFNRILRDSAHGDCVPDWQSPLAH
jgi:hypothetical protein